MNNQSRPITPPKKKSLNKFNKQRYDSLDGLRAYAAVGIVLMHVLSNITLKPSENYLTLKLIPFFYGFHAVVYDSKWIFALLWLL